jgi:hypothetical protein
MAPRTNEEQRNIVMDALKGIVETTDTQRSTLDSERTRLAIEKSATAIVDTLKPSQGATDTIWKWLIVGLLLLIAASIFAVSYAVLDGKETTDPSLLLTVFSTLVAGLLGFFIPSPRQSAGE